MSIAPPETLFGLSRVLSHDEATSLRLFLSAAWLCQRGRPPASLQSDLSELEIFFAPTSTGRRLREAIGEIGKVKVSVPSLLTQEIFLASPSGRGLLTPEGRVTLFLLEEHRGEASVIFHTDEVAWAYRIVADLYRNWSRDRLLEALGIKEHALRLPVISFNLTLLVNGSVGEEQALLIPLAEDREQELSSVLGPVIDAFVDRLRPDRKRSESFRLRGGWILTETSRHLFDIVTYTSKSVWIKQGRSRALLDRLARELARDRKRRRTDLEQAIDELVHAYARARPALSSWGLVHERSAETRTLREQLLAYFDKAQAANTDQ